MDSDTLKTLLSTQEQAFRSALELFLNQVNAKIENMQRSVADLTRSLEFSQDEIVDLKREVADLRKGKKSEEEAMKNITDDLRASSKSIKNLEERCNYSEDYSRRNNLQIVGLDECRSGETWEQTTSKVTKFLEEKLDLPNIQLERAHRVGRGQENGPRPIIVRFSRFIDREAARRNAIKLKGTRIFINEDLCKASQEVRKAKLPLLKKARSEGKVAYFSYTNLVIREQSGASVSRNGNSASGSVFGENLGRGGGDRDPVELHESSPAGGTIPKVGESGSSARGRKRTQASKNNKK